MPAIWTQSFPPRPHFTETNVKNQSGKVCVITGGATGLGFHVANILYSANAQVYIAGRSKDKATQAIEAIKKEHASSRGSVDFIYVDLGDFSTLRPAVQEIQSRVSKVDILWNNTGIGSQDGQIRSAQDNEIHYATNCVGPFLFTQLLKPQLEATEGGAARVIWTASMMVDASTPKGGLDVTNLKRPHLDGATPYACSKVGNWFIASELARREAAEVTQRGTPGKPRVIHLTINPGTLRTPIWRYVNWYLVQLLDWTLLYPAKYGAYTALWAGLSEDTGPEDTARYIIPWGRWHPQPREDLLKSLKSVEEGGTGVASKFVDWCE